MASGVHKNTDIKVETVSANSVCRQLPQKTAEQGLAAAVAFAEEVQWSSGPDRCRCRRTANT